VIFVDSSFWVALAAAADDHHAEAAALLGAVGNQILCTSNHVRGETWTFLNRRYGHTAAVSLLDRLEHTSRLRLEHVSQRLEDAAIVWLRQRDEREYSFVDATSFALMRSLRITDALAFDGDFAAAGFVELRAS
jgi:predicted nucleic acid-binding protein